MKRGLGLILIFTMICYGRVLARSFIIGASEPSYIEPSFFEQIPLGGDTIYISSERKKAIIFVGLEGLENKPVVVCNYNGQVQIDDQESRGGFIFRHCKYVKLTGAADPKNHYGFTLSSEYAGVIVEQNSSNFEIEFVKIDHEGFVGIQVKDDYGGNPPLPVPVFRELVIHDCLIQNVTEGMYLGETKSPGLEFRYVRVFNNIVLNSGREGIQIANMVEDVQVNNNFIINSGSDKLPGQGNNIQVGDNTVADVFNNVLINANECGVIVFGLGHINIFSNFISESNGIFIDNRKFTDEFASIKITNNYFSKIRTDEAILNFNELNGLVINGNKYEPITHFYHTNCKDCNQPTLHDNIETEVSPFIFEIIDQGIFANSATNSAEYKTMGPISDHLYSFNSWPEFENLEDIYVNQGRQEEFLIKAYTHDEDTILLLFENTPLFVGIESVSNGIVKLIVDAREQTIGIFPMFVTAKDHSHGVEIRKPFKIVVKSYENRPPELVTDTIRNFFSLEKSKIFLNVTDPDLDELNVELINAPNFITLNKVNKDEYFMALQPQFRDIGSFSFQIKVTDDYQGTIIQKIVLNIHPKELKPGVVLYRYNFGGPELYGEPLNWLAGNDVLDVITEQRLSSTGGYGWKGLNKTNAPDSLFGPFTYIRPVNNEVLFNFKCEPNNYIVSLYYSERQEDYDTFGATIYNVLAENHLLSPELIIDYNAIGNAMVWKSEVQVLDSMLELRLLPVRNYVKINGIEIAIAPPYFLSNKPDLLLGFPNPFADYLFIINNEVDQIVEWCIYNAKGKLVLKGNPFMYYFPFYRLETNSFPKGIYFLHIKLQSGLKIQKVIHQ